MTSEFTTLQLGSTGTDVRDLQKDLKNLKYYRGRINGVFDAKTRNAVIEFQEQNSLNANGFVNYETQQEIKQQVWLLEQEDLENNVAQQKKCSYYDILFEHNHKSSFIKPF